MKRFTKGKFTAKERAKKPSPRTSCRFPERANKDWIGPLVDYKENELLRKFLTSSSKLMSRKRAGTSAQEQSALKEAVKRARFLALLPYSGT
jgi:small subunit ribosomal protein S18